MTDDTRVCHICKGTFTNSGNVTLIQQNLVTGKDECFECAFKSWEDEEKRKKIEQDKR